MITGKVTGLESVQRLLQGIPTKAYTILEGAIRKEAIKLVAYVKENKLTGQALKVRTGRLRRSITARFEGTGETFKAFVGTNVKYGRIHEYGSKNIVNVRAHSRKVTQVFGKKLKNPVVAEVKGHPMAMNMPERSFLRSSLRENLPAMRENIRAAMVKGLQA